MILYIIYIVLLIILFFKIKRDKQKKKNLLNKIGNNIKTINILSITSYWGNILRYLILIMALSWIIYWLIYEPHENYGHIFIYIFIIDFCFYYKFVVFIGTNGLIVNLHFIPWDKIDESSIDEKKKYFKLTITSEKKYVHEKIIVSIKYLDQVKAYLNKRNR
ncbi:MAG: hypothetical protein R6V04_03265 [bacterium]